MERFCLVERFRLKAGLRTVNAKTVNAKTVIAKTVIAKIRERQDTKKPKLEARKIATPAISSGVMKRPAVY